MAIDKKGAGMDKHFIAVVADEARAVLYAHETRSGELTRWRTFDNDTARAKTSDLITDRGGRSFDSGGQGRHSVASDKAGPKEHAVTMFAKRIAEAVAADVNAGRCRGLSLIAAPRFLGELRDALETCTKLQPYITINKDVVSKDPAAIAKLLAEARRD